MDDESRCIRFILTDMKKPLLDVCIVLVTFKWLNGPTNIVECADGQLVIQDSCFDHIRQEVSMIAKKS